MFADDYYQQQLSHVADMVERQRLAGKYKDTTSIQIMTTLFRIW